MEISNKLRLLVIGIDGASHAVLDRMMTQGALPHFADLRKRSSFGALQSTFPPHTAPGWASMFTGVSPGEHGIYQFWSTKTQDYSARGVNTSDYGREPCWLTLERAGLKVGVYNVPMSHPPQDLNGGYMISWPLSPTLRYTSPPDLMKELVGAGLHYHSDIVTMYRGQDDYCDRTRQFISGRAETCLHLQKTRPVDALIVVFTEIDRVSHYFWGDEDEPATEVEDCYKDMDRALGSLTQLVDEDTLLIVASDHGFGACKHDFNVHELLEEHGLLKTRYEPLALSSKNLHDDATRTSWFDSPCSYRRVIDWEKTKFYMPTPGCFGLNANIKGRQTSGCLDPDSLPSAEKQLREAIASVVSQDGTPWFELKKNNEVYKGSRLAEAPDYLIVPKDFTIMPTPNLVGRLWSEPAQKGVHRPDGIVFISGPQFLPGQNLYARIEDIYPTILAHLGLPVPEELEGYWLVNPMTPPTRETVSRTNRTGRSVTSEETVFMDSQLREIGYF